MVKAMTTSHKIDIDAQGKLGHSKSQKISKVTAIFLDCQILPVGAVAAGSVCKQWGYPA